MLYNFESLPLLKDGQKWGRVVQSDQGEFLRRTIETVISIQDGKPVMKGIIQPNTVFMAETGDYFIRTLDEKEVDDGIRAKEAGIGYLINREYSGGGCEAIKDGKLLPLPKTLTNEFGVTYNWVDFKIYALACKNLFGYVEAKKVEPVYLISDVVGTPVSSVLNGVNEHAAVLKEGEVLVQNAYHGERYKQKRVKMEKSYQPTGEVVGGYEVWKPREFDADGKELIQQWTITDENIVGPLWGSFEFLAKAALNVTDLSDVYGCNYDVFAGNDIAKGSHQKLKKFMPANPMDYKRAKMMLEICREDASFAMQIAMRKPEFVEVPLGVCEVERQFRAAM